jgi:hypothetical protein
MFCTDCVMVLIIALDGVRLSAPVDEQDSTHGGKHQGTVTMGMLPAVKPRGDMPTVTSARMANVTCAMFADASCVLVLTTCIKGMPE